MGEPGEQPDLLAAALSQSGFSLDDILNPELGDDEPVTDPGSLLAQAMAESGVSNEPDPLLELLNLSTSTSQLGYVTQAAQSGPTATSVTANPTITVRQVPSPVPSQPAKPAVVTLQYKGQDKVKGQQIIRIMPSRTVPAMTPTSSLMNAQTVTAKTPGVGGKLEHGHVVSMGSPTIRMAIRTTQGGTATRPAQGMPTIVQTSSGSLAIRTTQGPTSTTRPAQGMPTIVQTSSGSLAIRTTQGPTSTTRPAQGMPTIVQTSSGSLAIRTTQGPTSTTRPAHGMPTIVQTSSGSLAIRTTQGVTSTRPAHGIPAIVHTSSGSQKITIPLPTLSTASAASAVHPTATQAIKTMKVHSHPGTPPIVVTTKPTGHMTSTIHGAQAKASPLMHGASAKPSPQMHVASTKPSPLSRIHTAPGSLNFLGVDGTHTSDGVNGAKKNMVPALTNDITKKRTQMPMRVLPTAIIAGGDDEDEEEEEDMGYAETYANYMPTKLKIGIQHPDPVVETSSMSSVEPPSVWYNLSIPESTIDYGHLSALQLEAITYACQQHETFLAGGIRAGFLIGDGAGVGKGRTVAGVIYENYLLGRKRALWLSVSNDLKYDAMRDLKDIGASNIPVFSLTKFKYAKINSKENGYCKKGVIFSTYSGLIGETHSNHKYRSRLKQLLHWCGKDFDGVIVLDECHKAKNLCPAGSSKPTKTGLTVLELQRQLPKARVVYCSATGASEPRNMAYMSRLGIWGKGTPFQDFKAFIDAIEKRGVGAMEIVAMDMKLRGMYMARQLSFHGVSFKINEIPLSKDFIKMYDEAVKLWLEARERFQKAAELMQAEHRMRKSMWGQFWSSHQRFFKYLCIAAKVKYAVKLAREAVKIGKCVVIGLQSTGEARTLDALEEAGGELNDFVSTAKGVFSALVEKHFPAPNRQKTADMFGLDLDHSGASSPANSESGRGTKRKRGNKWDILKQEKNWWDSDDEDTEKDNNKGSKQAKNNDKESDHDDSDFSFSDSEEDEGGASSNDDFNPFKQADSGDDDPWLNRSGRKPKAKKTKTSSNSNKNKKSQQTTSSTPKNSSNMTSALLAAGIGSGKTDNKKDFLRKSDSFTNIPSATSSLLLPGMDAYERVQLMKQELLDMLEELGPRLPPNTLDELIEELGGTDNVAEMTGRKGRVVSKDDGYVQYESRSEYDIPLEILNLTEKKRFMDGDKYIAIISEAASSGISLQADKRVANRRRRVHITLELPWSADRAIQQFGRTHRSNQVTAPEYVFLISELAGEQRFASIVAKRLESLGALTHGDRRATESRDLSRYNIDNKFGRTALETVMKSILELETPVVAPPKSYHGNFFEDAKQSLIGVGLIQMEERYQLPVLDKDYNNLSKFLNRILGMSVELQNALFAYFSDSLQSIIGQAKKDGQWDMGILDISSGEGQKVKKLEVTTFSGSFNNSNSTTQLYKVSAERGLSWHSAVRLWSNLVTNEEGFYVSQLSRNKKKTAILVKAGTTQNALKKQLMHIYRPNTGQQLRMETLPNIRKKYRKVNIPEEAQGHWQMQYTSAETQCTHAYWKDRCKKVALGLNCEVGLRRRTYYVLGGSVLSVWTRVEAILNAQPGALSKMQIIRLRIDDGSKIVGLLIPRNCIQTLRKGLAEGATTYTDTFT